MLEGSAHPRWDSASLFPSPLSLLPPPATFPQNLSLVRVLSLPPPSRQVVLANNYIWAYLNRAHAVDNGALTQYDESEVLRER